MSETDYIKAKIESAGRTLALFPRGYGRPQGHRSGWPEVTKEMIVFMQEDGKGLEIIMPETEVMRRKASLREVTELETVIGWIQDYAVYCRDNNVRAACVRVVWDAMIHHPESGKRIMSWRRIGKKYDQNHETVRRWYYEAISRIASLQAKKITRSDFNR